MNKKGFTLIELLIVIGIIAILASAVIVAINPGQQFAAARDAARSSDINTLYNSLISYQVSNHGWGELSTEITTEFTEICNTNLDNPDCNGLADLSAITPDHINQIPVDPQGSVSETADGTGYFIAQEGSVILVAENAETRFIGIGTTEEEYSGGGEESTFSCATEGQGEHTVDGDTIYCDASDNMWTPTLDLPADGSNDETYVWSDDCYEVETGCDSTTDGETNTNCILSDCNDDGSNAAEQCDNLNYAGETDWYLPAEDTLLGLYNEAGSTPTYDSNAQSLDYWSSTESSSFYARHVNFDDGNVASTTKNSTYRVRCLRR